MRKKFQFKGCEIMYPKLIINLNGIIDNMHIIQKVCKKRNISLSVTTKLLSGNKEMVTSLVENGAECICDSKIENLILYQNLNVEKWLIRLPMLSEIHEVVKYADVSLNSELVTIQALNEEAKKQNKTHKIILMYELGDLREGCLKEELKLLLKECFNLKNIEVYGLGVNLSCYGEILPNDENMLELALLVDELEEEFNIKFKIVSGGNSSSYEMLCEDKLPEQINNLRMGELIYLGRIPCLEKEVPTLNQDNFILKAQIIELKEKPSVPWGVAGKSNSFGEHSKFTDNGIRKRAILGIGKQDVILNGVTPLDDKIHTIGGSSDHFIIDVTDSKRNYQVGDIVEFKMSYSSVLQAMTSPYVKKEIAKK